MRKNDKTNCREDLDDVMHEAVFLAASRQPEKYEAYRTAVLAFGYELCCYEVMKETVKSILGINEEASDFYPFSLDDFWADIMKEN
jgi:hypothetical protein